MLARRRQRERKTPGHEVHDLRAVQVDDPEMCPAGGRECEAVRGGDGVRAQLGFGRVGQEGGGAAVSLVLVVVLWACGSIVRYVADLVTC